MSPKPFDDRSVGADADAIITRAVSEAANAPAPTVPDLDTIRRAATEAVIARTAAHVSPPLKGA